MTGPGLESANAAAVAVAWLGSHPRVTAALGGPGRVSAQNKPPYPRLRILHGQGGNDGDLRHYATPEVVIEALGDMDGSMSPAELQRLLWLAMGAMTELPERASVPPGDPVVTAVRPGTPSGWVPLPTSQPRYLASLMVTLHAPQ